MQRFLQACFDNAKNMVQLLEICDDFRAFLHNKLHNKEPGTIARL